MSPLHPPSAIYPEQLAPVFDWPAVGGPLNRQDNQRAPCSIDKLLADIRIAWDWAQLNHVPILSVDADRNGVYLRLVATPRLYTLFGDECATVRREEKNGQRIEVWLGCIGHIRAFWREVTCVH